ncbi:uncharacterized mitochondrial protein-like protein [Tanacetum coccineum]|uniref:Uncharacterized mitochondrial protein-like protein n=1 Tax=Tanacetum coccineum TaxID=301880 RepID=A0ABQ5AFB2_9ASTR
METKDTISSCSETKDVHAIKYKMSKAKERCMAYFRSLHSYLQVLYKEDLKGTHQLQKQLDKDEFQDDGSMAAFWVTQESKIDTGIEVDNDLVITESSGTESEVQDDSSMSGSYTDADDADIKPIYDEELIAEVGLTSSKPINRGLIQAIPTSLPPQPIGEIFLDYRVTLGFGSTGGLDLACPIIRISCQYGIQWVLGRITNSLPGVGTDRWVDRLAPGTINTWDLLKKAFIQRYCTPSLTAKQLEDIHNFKQEGDESYTRHENSLSTMNRQLLDSHGPIPGMRPAQALTVIQTMADHSQKWHDGTTSRNIRSSSSKDGLAALVNKLDNLGRDMKKLKESVH